MLVEPDGGRAARQVHVMDASGAAAAEIAEVLARDPVECR